MPRGRKRKSGKRERNGRLQRPHKIVYDKGSSHAQAIQALYGQDGCDAIGRAFRTGLLGDGQDAKTMLDLARNIAKAYWSAYEVGPFAPAIADKTSGSIPSISPEDARRREEWLNGILDSVNALGAPYRRNFDNLVIDVNPDHGPLWLDRLCYAHRTRGVMIEPADATSLQMALAALSMLANVEMPRVARLKAA